MRENSFYSDWYVTGSPKSSFSRWAAGGKDGERETSVPTLPGFCTWHFLFSLGFTVGLWQWKSHWADCPREAEVVTSKVKKGYKWQRIHGINELIFCMRFFFVQVVSILNLHIAYYFILHAVFRGPSTGKLWQTELRIFKGLKPWAGSSDLKMSLCYKLWHHFTPSLQFQAMPTTKLLLLDCFSIVLVYIVNWLKLHFTLGRKIYSLSGPFFPAINTLWMKWITNNTNSK